ncbi:MAG: hypothetical protein ABIB11_06390, partial [Candidatus Omnitrophota bacterium]
LQNEVVVKLVDKSRTFPEARSFSVNDYIDKQLRIIKAKQSAQKSSSTGVLKIDGINIFLEDSNFIYEENAAAFVILAGFNDEPGDLELIAQGNQRRADYTTLINSSDYSKNPLNFGTAVVLTPDSEAADNKIIFVTRKDQNTRNYLLPLVINYNKKTEPEGLDIKVVSKESLANLLKIFHKQDKLTVDWANMFMAFEFDIEELLESDKKSSSAGELKVGDDYFIFDRFGMVPHLGKDYGLKDEFEKVLDSLKLYMQNKVEETVSALEYGIKVVENDCNNIALLYPIKPKQGIWFGLLSPNGKKKFRDRGLVSLLFFDQSYSQESNVIVFEKIKRHSLDLLGIVSEYKAKGFSDAAEILRHCSMPGNLGKQNFLCAKPGKRKIGNVEFEVLPPKALLEMINNPTFSRSLNEIAVKDIIMAESVDNIIKLNDEEKYLVITFGGPYFSIYLEKKDGIFYAGLIKELKERQFKELVKEYEGLGRYFSQEKLDVGLVPEKRDEEVSVLGVKLKLLPGEFSLSSNFTMMPILANNLFHNIRNYLQPEEKSITLLNPESKSEKESIYSVLDLMSAKGFILNPQKPENKTFFIIRKNRTSDYLLPAAVSIFDSYTQRDMNIRTLEKDSLENLAKVLRMSDNLTEDWIAMFKAFGVDPQGIPARLKASSTGEIAIEKLNKAVKKLEQLNLYQSKAEDFMQESYWLLSDALYGKNLVDPESSAPNHPGLIALAKEKPSNNKLKADLYKARVLFALLQAVNNVGEVFQKSNTKRAMVLPVSDEIIEEKVRAGAEIKAIEEGLGMIVRFSNDIEKAVEELEAIGVNKENIIAFMFEDNMGFEQDKGNILPQRNMLPMKNVKEGDCIPFFELAKLVNTKLNAHSDTRPTHKSLYITQIRCLWKTLTGEDLNPLDAQKLIDEPNMLNKVLTLKHIPVPLTPEWNKRIHNITANVICA